MDLCKFVMKQADSINWIKPGEPSDVRWLSNSIYILIMFIFYKQLSEWPECPEVVKNFINNNKNTLNDLVKFIILYYVVSWNLALKFQHISNGPTVQHTIIAHARRELTVSQYEKVKDSISSNHYYLCDESIALLLTSPDREIRVNLTSKLLTIAHGLPDDWAYNRNRIFKMTDWKFHNSVLDYASRDTFNSPLFMDCQSKDALLSRLYDLKSGTHVYDDYSDFTNNTRETERAISDVKKSKSVSKNVEKQEAWIISTTEHRKRYKDYFKQSTWQKETDFSDSE